MRFSESFGTQRSKRMCKLGQVTRHSSFNVLPFLCHYETLLPYQLVEALLGVPDDEFWSIFLRYLFSFVVREVQVQMGKMATQARQEQE